MNLGQVTPSRAVPGGHLNDSRQWVSSLCLATYKTVGEHRSKGQRKYCRKAPTKAYTSSRRSTDVDKALNSGKTQRQCTLT
jgi:hypothetical protein